MKHLEKGGNGELSLRRCSASVLELPALDFLKLSEVFAGPGYDARIAELKAWLIAKGIRDFEAVPLNCDSIRG
jgi:hypothetical protein